jgi:hypothetical protein
VAYKSNIHIKDNFLKGLLERTSENFRMWASTGPLDNAVCWRLVWNWRRDDVKGNVRHWSQNLLVLKELETHQNNYFIFLSNEKFCTTVMKMKFIFMYISHVLARGRIK